MLVNSRIQLGGIRRTFDFIVFGNVFIGLCVLALYFTTCLINHIPVRLSPTALFVFASTCLYYNFHHHSHQIDLGSARRLIRSTRNLSLNTAERSSAGICILLLVGSVFFIPVHILFIFMVSGIFSLMYSIPLLPWKGKVWRLREFLHLKLPFLSASYALVTVLVPLFEYRMDIANGPVFLQALSRALFIYGLCIPFEIRDLERELSWGTRTLPVEYGIRKTKLIGIFVLLIGILARHILYSEGGLNVPVTVALDLSFLVAIFWIVVSRPRQSKYFSKFFVDGTMILQWLFVYLAVTLK